MDAILSVTAPFFALVLCGYLAGRQRVLPESAIAGLNTFVLYFALPCMLFRFGAHTPVLELLHPGMLGVWLLCAVLLVFSVAAAARGLGVPLTGFQIMVLTLVAALPSASNVSLLAERYGADNGRVARIILASTVAAFVTLSALVWWLDVRPPA